jgi:hypothetical protein
MAKSPDWLTLLVDVVDHLRRAVAQDTKLRDRLCELARGVLAEFDQESAQPVMGEAYRPASNLSTEEEAAPVEVEPADSPIPREPLPPLRLGQSALIQSTSPGRDRSFHRAEVTAVDLRLVESRCRLKAEGARWAAERRRRMASGADFSVEIEPLDRDLIARAKAVPDCFLWMNHPSGPSPSDLAKWDDVGGCFEALADGAALLAKLGDPSERENVHFEQTLDLVAEAQSAVRSAVERVDGRPDSDQGLIFNWLKSVANERQIYIERYMRLDDRADPTRWKQLVDRIQAVDEHHDEAVRRAKQRRKLLGKLGYEAKAIREGNGDATARWRNIINAVEDLLAAGDHPSNREIREVLLPIVEEVPDPEKLLGQQTFTQGFGLVLREIDRFLASRPNDAARQADRQPTTEVREVARLLGRTAVLLIGGERRPHAEEALKTAFDLKDLIWVSTREHESLEVFKPHIVRADVLVVLLAIRWSSHSYGAVRSFCEKENKLLVRLTAGYNPNQVASQILAQCGERLDAHTALPERALR